MKGRFPEIFKGRAVLDCGSLDINGCNRPLFEAGEYTGIDVGKGKNVDRVSLTHEFRPDEVGCYDTIISTECFEHDRYFEESLKHILGLLRVNGALLFTCATIGREEHGTVKHHPGSSPLTVQRGGGWERYYRNIAISEVVFLAELFEISHFEVNTKASDLYFCGVGKREVSVGGRTHV